MANQKISDLTQLVVADVDFDFLPITDGSIGETKKINLKDAKSSMSLDLVNNTPDDDKPISIATQIALDTKAPLALSIGNISTDYTLSVGDELGALIIADVSATDITITVPEDATYDFAIGTQMLLCRGGSNDLFVVGEGGVTIAGPGVDDKIANEAGVAALVKIGADLWLLFGDVA
jgi:hypothetical protein